MTVIKEKRSGEVKGRVCADGSTQRGKYTKEETASPTASADALMLALMIAALEGRDVAIADVTGAYLNADMGDLVHMKFQGATVDIMCEIDPTMEEFVVIEQGQRTLYVQLMKALYGCVQSALLWYQMFSTTLIDMGFKLNPYDLCVANATINGKQCTVLWYVDDNLISHVDPKVVTSIIKKIEDRFGKMTVTRGKSHEFLGMKIDFTDDKAVEIDMKEFLKGAIDDFSEDILRNAATPAKRDLFELTLGAKRLDKTRAELFHSIVAKLLYVCKRARMDIILAVAFLCTRVSDPGEDDWKKLKRLLEYLRGTLDDVLKLGMDSVECLKTWVDASYAVHPDMKSHTGGCMSFGLGVLMAMSTKQKLNTKSSTEAEVVGAADYIGYLVWLRMFLEEQGYTIKENIFYQDNMSAMKLETNGRMSSGKNTRHIDIKYFFAKDRVDTEGINIVHCPTEQMLADFFTKPLQGALFRKFKAVLLGHAHISTLQREVLAPVQERVERQNMEGTNRPGDKSLTDGEPRKATYVEVASRRKNGGR